MSNSNNCKIIFVLNTNYLILNKNLCLVTKCITKNKRNEKIVIIFKNIQEVLINWNWQILFSKTAISGQDSNLWVPKTNNKSLKILIKQLIKNYFNNNKLFSNKYYFSRIYINTFKYIKYSYIFFYICIILN